jgi:hypothetical protein
VTSHDRCDDCAAWRPDGTPAVLFPDGLGFYRLRTASRTSARLLRDAIVTLRRLLPGGQLAGIPLELALDYRHVVDGSGARRRVPVWTLTLKPPSMLQFDLDVRALRQIALRAREESGLLALPAPASETLEEALLAPEPGDAEARLLARVQGRRCDQGYWTRRWHAAAAGTEWESEAGRARFLDEYTGGRTASLAEFLAGSSDEQAAELLAALEQTKQRSDEQPCHTCGVFGCQGECAPQAPSDAAEEPAAVVDQEEPAPAVDPTWVELAQRATRTLRDQAALFAAQDGERPATAAQRKAVARWLLDLAGLDQENAALFLCSVFSLASSEQASYAQLRALLSWIGTTNAREAAQAIVALARATTS